MELTDITTKRAVIFALDAPIPIVYLNIYEEGDIWVKIQGCDTCASENRQKCCNNCGMFSAKKGCVWHLERNQATTKKPFGCMVKPYPDQSQPYCALEFKCIQGSRLGQVRRVKDSGDIFSNKG